MNLHCDEATLQGRLSYNQPLHELNSWGVGGACDCFYAPSSVDDLAPLFTKLHRQRALYWGAGKPIVTAMAHPRRCHQLRGKVRNITHQGVELAPTPALARASGALLREPQLSRT